MGNWKAYSPPQPLSLRRFFHFLLPVLMAVNSVMVIVQVVTLLALPASEMAGLLLLSLVLLAGMVIALAVSIFSGGRSGTVTEEALQATIRRYDRRTVQFQAAARIARDATAEPDLNALLRSAVNLVHERFGFYHAGIFLLDDSGDYAVLRAVAGGPASHSMLEHHHRLKVGEQGIIGFVTAAGVPKVVPDVAHDPHYYDNPALPATRSEMAVPLKVGGVIIGALDVQSIQSDAFDEEDVEIVQIMADLLAVAIHKANLHGQLQESAVRLEQRVQERTRELAGERAQLQAVLEAMTEGVVYREGGETIYMNTAFRNLLGYHPTDLNTGPGSIPLFGVSESDVQEIYEQFAGGCTDKSNWQQELRLRRQDGTEFDAMVTVQRIDRADEAVVIMVRDISQEKVLHEQKTRFVAYASHELRTPLTNLKTRLYLLEKQPHRFQEHYQILQQVTARMQRLVDDLLDKSRFERGRISLEIGPVILQDVIHDVVTLQLPEAGRKSIELTTSLSAAPVHAQVDHDRMIQVLTNLVSNAINYTQDGGKVMVSLQELPDGRAEICVEDNGAGIPRHLIDRVFQPFFRGDNIATKGTGLGLNIARQIIELHGGEITVESEEGKGSRFYVRLKMMPGMSLVDIS